MNGGTRELPTGWQAVRLGEVVTVETGGTPSRSQLDYWGGSIPWMASGEINQRRVRTTAEQITEQGLAASNAKVFPPGTVMIAMNGQGATRGKASVLDIKAACNQSLAAIQANSHFSGSFLFQYLSSSYEELRNVTGEGRSGLNLGLLRTFPILLPPLAEQRAIAAVLDCIDAAIERTDAVIAATERLRDALLHELLTHGVPGWHSSLNYEPGLGTIPASWEVVRLGDVAEVRNGTTPSRARLDYWQGNGVPFVKTGQVNDVFIMKPDEFITPQAVAAGAVVVPEGSVLIAMIGQGKTRGMTARLGFDAAINQNFAAVYGATEDFSLEFFFAWARHNYSIIRALGQGSNQDALNCALVAGMRVPKPPVPEQRAIAGMLDAVDQVIARAREEGSELQALKTSASDALLTGRVRVGANS